jgi:hypothetical protein
MLIIRFFHNEHKIVLNGKIYKATCDVRNEINKRRSKKEVVKTFPISSGIRQPYYPRKFPTGTWEVKAPIFTDDPEYAPVKIPTDAYQRVLTWDTDFRGYREYSGEHQTDAFYHLHYAKNSITTLGCIRLNSASDALEIANEIKKQLDSGVKVWLEVFANEE